MNVEVQHCPVVFRTRAPGNHFFGYYDVCPIDATGRYLLSHRVGEFRRMPRESDIVEVGRWDMEDGSYQKLAETRAYNWQQGSKLQWLGAGGDGEILFNDRVGDRFVTRVMRPSGEERVLPYPVYTVHPNGRSAVCVNFERTYFPRPGYSYQGIRNAKWDVPVHPDDGLFRLDLSSGELKRIVSTQHLVDHKPLSVMRDGTHYLEHAMFNPHGGGRLVFLHRFTLVDGGIYSRAYTCDEHGGDLHLLLDSGRFSHCGWRGPDELTAFASPGTALNEIRKYRSAVKFVLGPVLPLYRRLISPDSKLRRAVGGVNYLQLTDRSVPPRWHVLDESLEWWSDGHCTWHPTNPRWMLTDSYQDSESRRHLWIYDAERKKLFEIGRYFSPPDTCSTGWRCDLHPRFDRTGERVIIDSMHENDERQIYVIDVSSIVGA